MDNKEFVKYWNDIRKKGFLRYVLRGSLSMGLGIILGSLVIGTALKKAPLIFIIPLIMGGFIGGVLGAVISWKRNERCYNALI